jgi:multidrug efflux pump subunit AcrA (membrane-fusion protein)
LTSAQAELQRARDEAQRQVASAQAQLQQALQQARADAEAQRAEGENVKTQLKDVQEQLRNAKGQQQSSSLHRIRIDERLNTVQYFENEDVVEDGTPCDEPPPSIDSNSSSASPNHSHVNEGAPELVDEPIAPLRSSQQSLPAEQRQPPGILHYSISASSLENIRESLRNVRSALATRGVSSKARDLTDVHLGGIESELPEGTPRYFRFANPLYPPIPLEPNQASEPASQEALAEAENIPPQPTSGNPRQRRSKRLLKAR